MNLCPGSRAVTPNWLPCKCDAADQNSCTETCVWDGQNYKCKPKCRSGYHADKQCGCVYYGTYIAELTVVGDYCGPYGGVQYGCGADGQYPLSPDCACTSSAARCQQYQICIDKWCYNACPGGELYESCFCGNSMCYANYACASPDNNFLPAGNNAGTVCVYWLKDDYSGPFTQQAAYCNGMCFGPENLCDYGECICQEGGYGPCKHSSGDCFMGYYFKSGVCLDQKTPLQATITFPSINSKIEVGRCGGVNNAVVWAGAVCLKVGVGWNMYPRCPYYYETDYDCACQTTSNGLVAISKGSTCNSDGTYTCLKGDCLAVFSCYIQACDECTQDGTSCVRCDSSIADNVFGDCIPILPAYCEQAIFDVGTVACVRCEKDAILFKKVCYFKGSCDIKGCIYCGVDDTCYICNDIISELKNGRCEPILEEYCKEAVFSKDENRSICVSCVRGYLLRDDMCIYDAGYAKRQQTYLIVGVTLGGVIAIVAFGLMWFFRSKSLSQQRKIKILEAYKDRFKRRRLKAIRAARERSALLKRM